MRRPLYLIAAIVVAALAGTGVPAASTAANGPGQQPPTNTVAPTVGGQAIVGSTLTATAGTWNGPPATYSYQWVRCNSSGGACASIGGAASTSYVLVTADVRSTLRVVIMATNKNGSAVATSAATAVVVDRTSATTTTTTATTATTTTATTTTATTTTATTTTASTATTTTSATSTSTSATGVGVSAGGVIEWASDTDLARELDAYKTIGATWLRADLKWSVVERTRGSFDWSIYDRLVRAAQARGIKVLFMVGYSPAWARPSGTDDKHPPTNVDDYAAFADQAVRHFSPLGVKTYEIWNEPNLIHFWKPRADPAKYAAMLRASYPRMKAADASITVLAGAFAPAGGYNDPHCNGSGGLYRSDGSMNPLNFLELVYANGGRGYFDAISTHPYTQNPYSTHKCEHWNELSGTSPSMRSLMSANGDSSKRIWGTESGSSLNWGISEQRQGELVRDTINVWKTYAWAGPLLFYAYKNPHDDGFNLVRSDWSTRPAWHAFKTGTGS